MQSEVSVVVAEVEARHFDSGGGWDIGLKDHQATEGNCEQISQYQLRGRERWKTVLSTATNVGRSLSCRRENYRWCTGAP